MKTLIVILILAAAFSFLSAAPGDLLWKHKTSFPLGYSSELLYNSNIYFGSQNLYATDYRGNFKWCYKINLKNYSTPCISGNTVIIPCYEDKNVYALNASNGQFRWKKELTSVPTSVFPVVSEGKYFIAMGDRFLCMDTADGKILWETQLTGTSFSPDIWNNMIFASGGYYTSPGFKLHSMNASTGSIQWTYDFGNYMPGDPTVSDGVVYIGTGDKYVYAINAATGALVWKTLTSSGFTWGKPYIYKGKVVIAGNRDANLIVLSTSNGGILWEKKLTSDEIWSSPVVADDVIYIGTNNNGTNIYALNVSDGKDCWTFEASAFVNSSARIQNGVVYIGCNDTYLYAIETYGYAGFKDNKTASYIPFKSFSVSPNPFTDRLTISLPSSGAVYSLTGQLIIKLGKGKHLLDTSKWKQGVYIVKSGMECKRVVKIR